MKNLPLLILFLFALLLESSYSIRPKTDKYELPIIFNNRTKDRNTSNYIYFPFKLNKTYKSDLLFFQINSSISKKIISYSFTIEPKEKVNPNIIKNDKNRIWYYPNITYKQRLPKNIIYQIAAYSNRNDFSKETIIIRVGPVLPNENITCVQLFNVSTIIKNQKNNFTHNQRKDSERNNGHIKKHKHDHWNKSKFDWKHHGNDWLNKSDKYDKKHKKYHKRRHIKEKIFLAIFLITLWSVILVLYCLVNRRKKPFVAELKNPQQVSLSEYHNV